MLKFEGHNFHSSQTNFPKEVMQQPRMTVKQKSKLKTDNIKKTSQLNQSKPKNSSVSGRNADGIKTVNSSEYKHKATNKKKHTALKESIAVTQSQLQEILNVASFTKVPEINISEIEVSDQKDAAERASDVYLESATIPNGYHQFPDERSFDSQMPVPHMKLTDSFVDDNTQSERRLSNDGSHVDLDLANSSSNFSSNAHDSKMSLLEQKKMQWAREKIEMQKDTDWNPWGKPGCGAPMTSGSGIRKPSIDRGTNSRPNTNPSQSGKSNGESSRTVLPPLPVTAAPPSKKPIPPALRSSIMFGANNMHTFTGSDQAYILSKEEEKRKWLEELEHQREEQRLRKLLDQDGASSHFLYDQSNSPNTYSPNIRNPPNVPPQFSPTLPTVKENCVAHPGSPTSSVDSTVNQKSFLRGANVPLDPETKAELDRKRQKQREQQLAIQNQLEEKKQRQKAEKERQRLIEERENERIEKECEQLTQQQTEQVKKKESIQEADASSKTEAEVINESESNEKEESKVTKKDSVIAEGKPEISETLPPVTEKTMRSLPAKIISPYVENRILTPTKYRGNEIFLPNPPRECGTQTDASLPSKKDASTDVDNHLSKDSTNESEGKANSKKFSKAEGKQLKKDDKQSDRPKWGVNQPDKSYKKQSDKDVTYCNRRRLQEMRRKRLEEEAVIHNGQPQIGKTRSSARHQRRLLARETNSPASQISYGESEHVYHQESIERLTPEDSGTDSFVRKQRRQWDSPSTDEIPNFYTQPHQLPARRNSRSQSSRSMTANSQDVPMTANYLRENIPSAPELRQNQVSSWNSTMELRCQSPSFSLENSHRRSLENIQIVDGAVTTKDCLPNTFADLGKLRRSLMNYQHSKENNQKEEATKDSLPSEIGDSNYVPYLSSSLEQTALPEQISPSNTSWNRHRSPQKTRILQQLSAIRQGLRMKQQEMDKLLHPNEESVNKSF